MASGETSVAYGALRIFRCETLDFRQEQVFDDLSQTDLMYFKFTVKVRGYVKGMNGTSPINWCSTHAPITDSDGVNPAASSAALNLIGMRIELPPRQTFSYRLGGVGATGGYLAVYAEPCPLTPPANMTHLDVNNGPRCKSFVVTRIVSDNVVQVEAEFEVCKIECSASANAAPPSGIAMRTAGIATGNTKGVLSNRWAVQDELDANLKTVRTYHGRLRVASSNFDANQLRYFVVPPLQPGLRRDHISFSVSPDGLNLDYMVRDVEVIDSAPPPAKKWSVRHTETMDQGLIVHAECEVTLTGDRSVNKADLIIVGMNVLIAKLLNGERNATNTTLLEYISITDFIGDDLSVSVSGRVTRVPKKAENGQIDDAFQPWFLGNQTIGKPLLHDDVYKVNLAAGVMDPNYDGTRSYGGLVPSTGLPGSSPYYEGPVELIGAFLPYLQTPCNDTHKIVESSIASDDNSSPFGGYYAPVTAAVDPDWTETDRDLFSSNAVTEMYTHWKMESIYKESEMVVGMPIAGDPAEIGAAATTFVSLARPQAIRVVRIEAERLGEEPEMPSGSQLAGIPFDTSGTSSTASGYVPLSLRFLKKVTRYATPSYTAGGQRLWRVAANYYFGLNRRPTPDEKLPIGRSIWTVDGNLNTTTLATKGWSP